MRRAIGLSAGALLAVAMITGVAGTAGATDHKPAHHSTAITEKAAAKQYLGIVGPVNTDLSAFANAAGNWPSDETGPEAFKAAGTAIAALRTVQTDLLKDEWPKGAQADVKIENQDVAPLLGDLQGLDSANALSISSLSTNLTRDGQILTTQSNILRHDLGLPAEAN
jgi:hypothetical protein